ncbi:MAG: AI-2E family transporter [Prevotellaceae bacterium]|jgi:predicted PurR-regulated permease PerM|nr:AI-2E family transporter [Prevotellaceae bacterium]
MQDKEQYWKISLIAIILIMGVAIFLEIKPFLSGLLGAVTIYILVRRQMSYLADRRKMRRSIAATLIMLEAILCFLVPLGLVVWLLVGKVQGINLDPQAIITPIQHTADLIHQRTGYDLLGTDALSFLLSLIPKIGQVVMNSISSFTVNIVVLVLILYFMLIGGQRMERYISDILPFNQNNTENVVREINMIVRSNAIGIPLLALIQGAIAMVGYWIFNVPDVLLAGFLTCIATLVPMIGTVLVWLPIAIYLAITGHWFDAVGLTLFGALVIAQLDNLIRFILQKKMADTHPLITIFGVVIGLSLFGFMGIIFGPLLLSLFLLFVDMFKREYLDTSK